MAVFLESEFQLGIHQACDLVDGAYRTVLKYTPQETAKAIEVVDLASLQKELSTLQIVSTLLCI